MKQEEQSRQGKSEKIRDTEYERAIKAQERLEKKVVRRTKIEYDPINMASDLWHDALLHDEEPEEE